MTLGGVDPKYAKGAFVYHPVNLKAWWVVNLKKVCVGLICTALTDGIVDTGTSVIVGTPKVVTELKLAAGLPPIGNAVDCDKIDTYKTITFTIDNTNYPLSPRDYIIKVT